MRVANFRNPCEKSCENRLTCENALRNVLRNFLGVMKFGNPCKINCDFTSELLGLPASEN